MALTATAIVGTWALTGTDRLLVIAAAVLYVVGVQLPTFVVNIPLNDVLQTLDSSTMDETSRRGAREHFEPRWNRWNAIRTGCASIVSLLLLLVLLGL